MVIGRWELWQINLKFSPLFRVPVFLDSACWRASVKSFRKLLSRHRSWAGWNNFVFQCSVGIFGKWMTSLRSELGVVVWCWKRCRFSCSKEMAGMHSNGIEAPLQLQCCGDVVLRWRVFGALDSSFQGSILRCTWGLINDSCDFSGPKCDWPKGYSLLHYAAECVEDPQAGATPWHDSTPGFVWPEQDEDSRSNISRNINLTNNSDQ